MGEERGQEVDLVDVVAGKDVVEGGAVVNFSGLLEEGVGGHVSGTEEETKDVPEDDSWLVGAEHVVWAKLVTVVLLLMNSGEQFFFFRFSIFFSKFLACFSSFTFSFLDSLSFNFKDFIVPCWSILQFSKS